MYKARSATSVRICSSTSNCETQTDVNHVSVWLQGLLASRGSARRRLGSAPVRLT